MNQFCFAIASDEAESEAKVQKDAKNFTKYLWK